MVGISFCMTSLFSSTLSCLREKGLKVCPSMDRRKGWCSQHPFLPQKGIIQFVMNPFCLIAMEYSRIDYSFGLMTYVKTMSQVGCMT